MCYAIKSRRKKNVDDAFMDVLLSTPINLCNKEIKNYGPLTGAPHDCQTHIG
jgi:hypothetical protein